MIRARSFSIPFSRSISVFAHLSIVYVNYYFFLSPGFIYLWFVLDRLFNVYVLDCYYVNVSYFRGRVIISYTFVTLTSNIIYFDNHQIKRFKSEQKQYHFYLVLLNLLFLSFAFILILCQVYTYT